MYPQMQVYTWYTLEIIEDQAAFFGIAVSHVGMRRIKTHVHDETHCVEVLETLGSLLITVTAIHYIRQFAQHNGIHKHAYIKHHTGCTVVDNGGHKAQSERDVRVNELGSASQKPQRRRSVRHDLAVHSHQLLVWVSTATCTANRTGAHTACASCDGSRRSSGSAPSSWGTTAYSCAVALSISESCPFRLRQTAVLWNTPPQRIQDSMWQLEQSTRRRRECSGSSSTMPQPS